MCGKQRYAVLFVIFPANLFFHESSQIGILYHLHIFLAVSACLSKCPGNTQLTNLPVGLLIVLCFVFVGLVLVVFLLQGMLYFMLYTFGVPCRTLYQLVHLVSSTSFFGRFEGAVICA